MKKETKENIIYGTCVAVILSGLYAIYVMAWAFQSKINF